MSHGQTHATHVDLGDAQLTERINAGMAAVEEKLRTEIDRGPDFLKDKVSHLSHAGGKRFRPMMALLASEFGKRPQAPEVVKAATVVEWSTWPRCTTTMSWMRPSGAAAWSPRTSVGPTP